MNGKRLDYVVDGFVFHDPQMAERAARESEGIKFIRKNTNMDDADLVLKVYHKIMEQKLFETPVGVGYLKELQEYLIMVPHIRNEEIRPIEIEEIIHTKEEAQKDGGELRAAQTKQENKASSPKNSVRRPLDKRTAAANQKLRGRLKASIAINVALLLLVAAMFAISLTSKSPTILNYESKLVDKYASWEEELTEREKQVREREHELNLEP